MVRLGMTRDLTPLDIPFCGKWEREGKMICHDVLIRRK